MREDALNQVVDGCIIKVFPDKLERSTTSLILKSTKTASSCRTIEKADRALTVQTPIFRGYITKNVKSYDLTFNIWCTSRDSNPGPTD